ncbi:aspartyl-phosphate phosphatase Spo0E family protein [Mesobacillus maritimus]|uniref:aspartyl-phosphate phosphatase Spo0E family protein n=1 Tax=Mesobacillus maritimus TaxID=1643336 RepID=UPI002040C989|nr:aspartyl-phosphate phosphatase Spo0E family protein [Mesobacillus maritimus]MCM3586679.1 aspartyl-phosphate phosphatase Spo0E family protein [Mesobacillus maritimus]MCM3668567.1 aspartyl-phosphate phosphatase Spo0E family protein [Mesobacillus maritimus]
MNTSTLSTVLTPTELLGYIEFLRQDLINKGLTYGFNSDRTLQASRELDYFIFEYQKITYMN